MSYLLIKREKYSPQLTTIHITDEIELRNHLNAMWNFTKYELVAIISVP